MDTPKGSLCKHGPNPNPAADGTRQCLTSRQKRQYDKCMGKHGFRWGPHNQCMKQSAFLKQSGKYVRPKLFKALVEAGIPKEEASNFTFARKSSSKKCYFKPDARFGQQPVRGKGPWKDTMFVVGETKSGGVKWMPQLAPVVQCQPKRAMNAYFFFLQHHREQYLQTARKYVQDGFSPYALATKMAAADWKKMAAPAKKPWEKKAHADKVRYNREKAAFHKWLKKKGEAIPVAYRHKKKKKKGLAAPRARSRSRTRSRSRSRSRSPKKDEMPHRELVEPGVMPVKVEQTMKEQIAEAA